MGWLLDRQLKDLAEDAPAKSIETSAPMQDFFYMYNGAAVYIKEAKFFFLRLKAVTLKSGDVIGSRYVLKVWI